MTSICRNARYDTLTMLLACAALASLTITRTRLRLAVLGLIGFSFPWAGIQLLPFVAAIGLVTLVCIRPIPRKELISLGIGITTGAVSVCLLYLAKGTFPIFLASALGHGVYFKTENHGFFAKIFSLPSAFVGNPLELWQTDRMDYSSTIVLALVIAFSIFEFCRSRKLSMPAVFGLGVSFMVPVTMHLAAHFRIYYRWMAFIPCSICLLMLAERHWNSLSKRFRIAFVVACSIACLIGLPVRLAYLALHGKERNYASLKALISEQVQPSDHIYTNSSAYFAAIAKSKFVFSGGYLSCMTPSEKSEVNLLILSPETVDGVQEKIPGSWQKVGELNFRKPGGLNCVIYRR